jgi:hypothetical protein
VRAFSGSLMVHHDRLIDWDAHPRRSGEVIVDDRILTSCAGVRARMDGWWTVAAGTGGSTIGSYRRGDDRSTKNCLDANARSHGSMIWSARASGGGKASRGRKQTPRPRQRLAGAA